MKLNLSSMFLFVHKYYLYVITFLYMYSLESFLPVTINSLQCVHCLLHLCSKIVTSKKEERKYCFTISAWALWTSKLKKVSMGKNQIIEQLHLKIKWWISWVTSNWEVTCMMPMKSIIHPWLDCNECTSYCS